MLRGIRGATTVEKNEYADIVKRVEELLLALTEANRIAIEEIGAVIFSSTPDLNAAFPAAGARSLGWNAVPLFGTQEIDNPEGPALCIRVLILWNTDKPQAEIRHIYLHGAKVLRQDIANK
ncbi:MAG: chorismate mutase [Negativicutes bacterium]|nr:chorismate mutase [Negativicutes bacterium]